MNLALNTFDIDATVKEPNGFHSKEWGHVFDRSFEWIALIQLKMHVDVKTEVCLNVTAQRIEEMLP